MKTLQMNLNQLQPCIVIVTFIISLWLSFFLFISWRTKPHGLSISVHNLTWCIVQQVLTMPPSDAGAQSTGPLADAWPTAFISNVPLPRRLELHGNLVQIWSKGRQVWTVHETVTNFNFTARPLSCCWFITCIGPETLDIHSDLPFENELDMQKIDKIMDLWHSYCVGEANFIYERFKFSDRNQTLDESLDAYATALRGMAATCSIGNFAR